MTRSRRVVWTVAGMTLGLTMAVTMLAEMMPADVKVTGGTMNADTATLTLTGTSGGEKSTGETRLTKEGGAWKLDKESWKN